MSETSSAFIGYLRKKGYKVTPQRLEIYEAVKSSREHPTADDVYREVKKKNPTISVATVYKALELLEKIGEIQSIGQINGKTVYDSNTALHVNLHCINCNRIEDIESDLTEKLVKEIQNKTKSKIVGQTINFYGYCSECQNKIK
jgi:Fur family peroxide stress response transcriptional regulator